MSATPMLRCEDAAELIAWLTRAFGFRQLVRADGPGGAVIHCELRAGTGTIILGSLTPDRRAGGFRTPKEAGGITAGVQIFVPPAELDAHYARARAAGAEIALPLAELPFGRGYAAKDPQGNLWSFATYAPGLTGG